MLSSSGGLSLRDELSASERGKKSFKGQPRVSRGTLIDSRRRPPTIPVSRKTFRELQTRVRASRFTDGWAMFAANRNRQPERRWRRRQKRSLLPRYEEKSEFERAEPTCQPVRTWYQREGREDYLHPATGSRRLGLHASWIFHRGRNVVGQPRIVIPRIQEFSNQFGSRYAIETIEIEFPRTDGPLNFHLS